MVSVGGAAQRDAYGRAVEPRRWGMTLKQLTELRLSVECFYHRRGEDIMTKSMSNVVQDYIKPSTAGTGVGFALLLNREKPVTGTIMISHIWDESFKEFCEYLEHEESSLVGEGLWICAFALFQCQDGSGPSIPDQIGLEILESPFAQVVRNADVMLVVQTPTAITVGGKQVTVYDRLWCVLEMSEAVRYNIPVKILGRVILDSVVSFEPELARCGNPNLPPNDDEKAIRKAIEVMPVDSSGHDGWKQIKRRIGKMVMNLARSRFSVDVTSFQHAVPVESLEVETLEVRQAGSLGGARRVVSRFLLLLLGALDVMLWMFPMATRFGLAMMTSPFYCKFEASLWGMTIDENCDYSSVRVHSIADIMKVPVGPDLVFCAVLGHMAPKMSWWELRDLLYREHFVLAYDFSATLLIISSVMLLSLGISAALSLVATAWLLCYHCQLWSFKSAHLYAKNLYMAAAILGTTASAICNFMRPDMSEFPRRLQADLRNRSDAYGWHIMPFKLVDPTKESELDNLIGGLGGLLCCIAIIFSMLTLALLACCFTPRTVVEKREFGNLLS